MAASRTSLLSLLSISLFFLQQTGAVTEFGDFDTLAREATLLYKSYSQSFANYGGYHTFYPYLNFTCSGNITKVSFITYARSITNWLRFATWSVNTTYEDESLYVRKEYADAAQSVIVNTSDSYHLYELTLNRSSWIRFDIGDVFGIRLPWNSPNPLHQQRGGFTRFTHITTGNSNNRQFDIGSLQSASNIPLVSLETDNSTCARGFLSRESLNTILQVDIYEVDIDEGTSLHDRVTSQQFIIPAMNFSRSGILRKWIFAGTYYYRRESVVKFQVWRRNDSGYHLVNETSVEPRPTGYLNVYEVVLPESPPVVVEAGDMFGVYLPEEDQSRYTLAYVEDSEGYEFMELDGDTGNIIDCDRDNCTDNSRGRPLVIADMEGLEEMSDNPGGSSGGGSSGESSPGSLVIADIDEHGGGTVTQFTTEATSEVTGGDRGMKFVPVVVAAVVVPLLVLMAIISVVIVITIVIYWKRRTVKNNCTYVDTPTDKNPAYGIQESYTVPGVSQSTSNNPDDHDYEYDYVESIKEVTNKPKSEISMTSNTCYGNHERFYPSTDINYRQNQYDNDCDYI